MGRRERVSEWEREREREYDDDDDDDDADNDDDDDDGDDDDDDDHDWYWSRMNGINESILKKRQDLDKGSLTVPMASAGNSLKQ